MAIANNLYNQFQRTKINITAEHNEEESNMVNNQKINMNNAYQQYQNNAVNTASPQELTMMLYSGLVKFLKIAIQGIEENSIEKSSNNLIRSQDIIAEFMCTLDMDYEISGNLMALYDYMNRRLIEANLHKDKAIVEEVLMFAEQLRDTWAQAMKLAKQQAASK